MPHTSTCHCGAARIEVDRLPDQAVSCNCTWCSRTGGLWGYYTPDEVRVLVAPTQVYAPNVLNEHHFCGTCSGLMFNYGPAWTEENSTSGSVPEGRQYAINLRMIDEDAVRALPIYEMNGRHQW